MFEGEKADAARGFYEECQRRLRAHHLNPHFGSRKTHFDVETLWFRIRLTKTETFFSPLQNHYILLAASECLLEL